MILLGKKINNATNLVVFTHDKKKVNRALLSDHEADYVLKQFEKGDKLVVINQYNRLLLVQWIEKEGSKAKINERCRQAGDAVVAILNKAKAEEVMLYDEKSDNELMAFAEGMDLGNYQFLKYKTNGNKEANTLNRIIICCPKLKQKQIDELNIVIEATKLARDLVNEPNSYLTATKLAGHFQQMGQQAGFKVEVFNKLKIESMKMGGLLAVNKGSVDPPTFTVMEYKPARPINKQPVVLVGKGVVYDTGGLSLKPTPNSMDYMKCDMAGSAAVAAAIYAVAKAKLPVHVVALVPATDNRPGGNAYAPGDVITMMSGKTVEMLNADAEGRMILADALHFAKQYKPQLVCEFSTLTGAASAAIGQYGMVAMGTVSDKTKKQLDEAAQSVHERLAHFPFWDEYDDLIKSDIADMKNIGGPVAGAITAGKFLARYIDYPFMHFDIAGPAFTSTRDSYRGKGGTGIGVRFLFSFLKSL